MVLHGSRGRPDPTHLSPGSLERSLFRHSHQSLLLEPGSHAVRKPGPHGEVTFQDILPQGPNMMKEASR